MDIRRLIFLGVAIFLAGAIAMSVRSATKPAAPTQPVQQAQNLPAILVAKAALPAGTFIQPDQLAWQIWPSDTISTSYLKKGEHTAEEFAGSVVRTGIAAGEPITDGRLIKTNDRGFMAAVLTPGMRAISVQINETTGISGFIFPGDKVDLILTQSIQETGEGGAKKNRRASETILRDIRVLAVDQRVDDQKPEAKIAKTATLEVTAKQAERLALVADLGKLSLSLRSLGADQNEQNAADAEPSFTWDTEASYLLGPNQKPSMTSIVRGGSVEDVVLNKGGS